MTEDEWLAEELKRIQSVNPSLRGWTDGDEERPVPISTENLNEEAQKSWRQPQVAPPNKTLEPFSEFTLYYGKTGARHIARARRANQIRYASDMLTEKMAPLVLMTGDFKVFRAKNIWSLLWIYLKIKLFGIKSPKTDKRPLPKY